MLSSNPQCGGRGGGEGGQEGAGTNDAPLKHRKRRWEHRREAEPCEIENTSATRFLCRLCRTSLAWLGKHLRDLFLSMWKRFERFLSCMRSFVRSHRRGLCSATRSARSLQPPVVVSAIARGNLIQAQSMRRRWLRVFCLAAELRRTCERDEQERRDEAADDVHRRERFRRRH
jgi:hypothetical protein